MAVTFHAYYGDALPVDTGDYDTSSPTGGVIHDGNLSSFDSSAVQLFPTAESYAVVLWDWGTPYDNTLVELWGRCDHINVTTSEFAEYVIEASDDHATWTTLQTATIAETGLAAKREWSGTAQARYIRMYFHSVVTGDVDIPASWPIAVAAINEVEVTGTPADCTAPSVPTLTAESEDCGESVTLTWTEATGDAVIVYEVEDVDTATLVYSGIALTTTISGLTPGETYTYRVRATNDCGDSAWSDPVSVTTDATPPTPTLTYEKVGGYIIFTFAEGS
jgi:IS1 family transposase